MIRRTLYFFFLSEGPKGQAATLFMFLCPFFLTSDAVPSCSRPFDTMRTVYYVLRNVERRSSLGRKTLRKLPKRHATCGEKVGRLTGLLRRVRPPPRSLFPFHRCILRTKLSLSRKGRKQQKNNHKVQARVLSRRRRRRGGRDVLSSFERL